MIHFAFGFLFVSLYITARTVYTFYWSRYSDEARELIPTACISFSVSWVITIAFFYFFIEVTMINSLTNTPNNELKYHQDNSDFIETVLDRLDDDNLELEQQEEKWDELYSKTVDCSNDISVGWDTLNVLFDEFENEDCTKEEFFKRLNFICRTLDTAIEELSHIEIDMG
jgi:hypothetical protein